ncbi:hypothetical protein CSA37_04835 [Candidatus Fermentibacteria bacterium]|nr:MAG: hypothetical protein CSA37_04835 [Candidatus Fermentibacteria bacterium]
MSVTDQILDRFSGTIRFRTVSGPGVFPLGPFHQMREYSASAWPLVFSRLEMHLIGEASIVLIWRGFSKESQPFMLAAHQDVVPAGEDGWLFDPFGGVISQGRVYGRGTVDYKCGYAGMLEAAHRLLESGFTPERTVVLAFGHDEETGGLNGAASITSFLLERGIRCSSVLDEGGYIYTLPDGCEEAVIATSEKGYATFSLRSSAVQGHASVPGEVTAIGKLARVICSLEDMNLTSADSTTLAPTMIHAGQKENVLPASAELLVNTRPAPGTSVNDVLRLITEAAKPFGVSVALVQNPSVSEPSDVSSWETPDMNALLAAAGSVLNSRIPVREGIFPAATDSRRYRLAADNTYRFMPVRLGSEGIGTLHSVNESISTTDYLNCVRFYERYISEASAVQS